MCIYKGGIMWQGFFCKATKHLGHPPAVIDLQL